MKNMMTAAAETRGMMEWQIIVAKGAAGGR